MPGRNPELESCEKEAVPPSKFNQTRPNFLLFFFLIFVPSESLLSRLLAQGLRTTSG